MNIKEKLVSGRFILTVICAFVFAYCSITKILPIDKVSEIILIVIYGYFTRNDRTQNGGQPK